jgi:outer membrane immunogenic protein
MRAFVLAGAALIAGVGTAYSADLPVKSAYIGAPYNWSGCYIGAQVGYARMRDADTERIAATGALAAHTPAERAEPDGVKAGGFIGCNWQIAGPWVIGAELDGEWADLNGSARFFDPAGDHYSVRAQAQGSLRGRVGYAIDRTLYYATGGGGAASVRHTYVDVLPAGIITTRFTDISGGITGGFGVEYAFLGNFTGRIEYRYADFGQFNYNPAPALAGFSEHHRVTEHAVRAGLAFKFGGAPPPRQY